jgi:hypothetical protein
MRVSRTASGSSPLKRAITTMQEVISRSPASSRSSTERSRRHRRRRRLGTRCITVEVNESEIAGLVAGGYLPEEARDDPVAIKAAIEVVISDMAFEQQQKTWRGS